LLISAAIIHHGKGSKAALTLGLQI